MALDLKSGTDLVALFLVIVAIFAKAWASKENQQLRGELIEERSRRQAAEERRAETEEKLRALREELDSERASKEGAET